MFNITAFVGSLLGFLLGWFSGIPFAGLIGALIGGSIGRSLGRVRLYRYGRNSSPGSGASSAGAGFSPHTGSIFFESLFSMLGRLAAADGRVTAEEERALRQALSADLNIHAPQSVEAAMELFRQAARGNVPFGEYARRAREALRFRPQLLEVMLDIMVRVSAADGHLHGEEDRLLREAAMLFSLGPGYYQALKARYGLRTGQSQGTSPGGGAGGTAPYAVLGVGSSASESEIRRAYRRKAGEYHPDKIAGKGLPKEFTDFASQKFQEIQGAWEIIRKERNF